MDFKTAKQISLLLNTRNNLVRNYSPNDIIDSGKNYKYLVKDHTVVCVCELKKVQWYQFEICHLSVHPKYEGQGLASELLDEVIGLAKTQNGRILQATIREKNKNSSRLFIHKGFIKTIKFHYPISGNDVFVYQKSISVR